MLFAKEKVKRFNIIVLGKLHDKWKGNVNGNRTVLAVNLLLSLSLSHLLGHGQSRNYAYLEAYIYKLLLGHIFAGSKKR